MKNTIIPILILPLFLLTFFSCNEEAIFNEPIEENLVSLELEQNLDGLAKDQTFILNATRWGIKEGVVSNAVAKNNTVTLNFIFKRLAELGVTKVQVNKMDAFFEVSARVNNPKIKSESAILIPSNFEVIMTNDVFLRVQPNAAHAYSLMMVFEGENIKISGGNLIGDRWKHTYDPVTDLYGKTYEHHDWGHLLHISGGKNIVIDGVYISDAMADGIVVHASNIRAKDGTPGNAVISENVIIKNSTINESRRDGLSLLDGDGILVENCKIINTGQGKNPTGVKFSSAGTWPKYGISFEAWRVRESDGTLLEYERIENVTLRGNTFTGNTGGDIVLFTCSNVTIEDNYFDSKISNKASNNIIIRNNVMEARINNGLPEEYGIIILSLLDPFGNEFNYNYKIYDNKINGYKNSMVLSGENFEVHDNLLSGFKSGIAFGGHFYYSNFQNNTLNTDISTSYGYVSRGGEIKGMLVKNENITVGRRAVDIFNVIADANENLVFDNCKFTTVSGNKNNISGCENITIQNSDYDTEFSIINNSKNILLLNNNI